MTTDESTYRALKATRLYATLRLTMEALADEPVDAACIVGALAEMSSDQLTGLAQCAGVKVPSMETVDVLREIAMVFAEQEEHYAHREEAIPR